LSSKRTNLPWIKPCIIANKNCIYANNSELQDVMRISLLFYNDNLLSTPLFIVNSRFTC
jgi:hypothetical protein